jgi:glutamine cyclotransferase
MRRSPRWWLSAVLLAGCAAPAGVSVRGDTLEVVATLPHDPDAYTQGLAYVDGGFFESTGIYGASTVRRLEAATGEIAALRDLDARFFGEGLAHLDGLIYQLTWREGVGFVYDASTLEPVGSFRYDGEGWGLTTDGAALILSDGTYRLRFLDPATFEVTRTIEVDDGGRLVSSLNELEWVDGEIWANIYLEDNIARIDPATGQVRGWVNVRGMLSALERMRGAEVANGIAYDSVSGRLWVTGKKWPRIFEVRTPR